MNPEEDKKKEKDAKAAEAQLKATLRLALEDSAYDRLTNVSVANQELFMTAARQVLMAFKRVGRKITDGELVMVLRTIKQQSETKTTITFHKK